MLLSSAARLPLGTRGHVDRTSVVRVVDAVSEWADVVDLAYAETRVFGAGSLQVTGRLVASGRPVARSGVRRRCGPEGWAVADAGRPSAAVLTVAVDSGRLGVRANPPYSGPSSS